MKLSTTPRVAAADADWQRQLREMNAQINALAEGRLSASYTALPAAPTTGTWAQGDRVRNSAPTVLNLGEATYVITEWVCVEGGTPGTWVELRMPSAPIPLIVQQPPPAPPPAPTPAPSPPPPPPPPPPPTTNLLDYSEQFDNVVWATGTTPVVSANVSAGADATTTADELTFNYTGSPYVRQHYTAVDGQQYTFSCYVQQGRSGSAINVRLTTNNSNAWNTGASTLVALTSTLTRVSVTWTQSGSTVAALIIGNVDASGNGDATCNGTVRLWGAQLETGATAGTYQRKPISAPAPAPAPAPGMPAITTAAHPSDWLQSGNSTDAYFLEDNRWGRGGIVEGPAADQFMQEVERALTVGTLGETAFRMRWRWPTVANTEVKGYPAQIYGRKPGYFSTTNKPGGDKNVRLPDGAAGGGTIVTTTPAGGTPGTILPLQLPLPSLHTKTRYNHNITATGQGQLVYDIWLQSFPGQDSGFNSASITHEIMIPLTNWGNYGAHGVSGGRNPNWYDHDAVIGGRTYHVYCTKNSPVNPVTGNTDYAGTGPGGVYSGLHYNFSFLNGSYINNETGAPRRGWKMIAFVPEPSPWTADATGLIDIDLSLFLNYIATRVDSRGVPWALGTEHLVSVELGVEPVAGEGDITCWDYRVWRP